MGLIQWLRNRSERSERTHTAWANMEILEDNSLTVFQNKCNKELLEAFHSSNLIEKQSIEGTTEKYIVGILPKSNAEYWIYEDGAQIEDQWFERWDYETPEALIEDFISKAKKIEI